MALSGPLSGALSSRLTDLTSSAGGGVAPTPSAPVNTVLPAITGTATVGNTLTVSDGTWSGYPAPAFTYQWKRGGVNISLATAATYLLVTADGGTTVSCDVTATNASGSVPASATGVAVPAVGPSAIILPTASFGSTNLLAWWDVSQGYTDIDGAQVSSVSYDSVGYNSVAALEDVSGRGYGAAQGDKSLQPIKGASGGPIADGAGHTLSVLRKSLINSVGKLTFFARVKPRSTLYAGGGARELIYISRSTGTSNIRFAVSLTSGTTGRRLFVDYGVADSATAGDSRTTTSGSGPQLTDDAWNTVIVTIDMSVSPCVVNFYLNSTTSGFTDSGLVPVTGAAPFTFGSSDSLAINLDDNVTPNRPSYCEIPARGLIADVVDATRLGQIKTYLDAIT